jgi:hypothetical protein
MVVALSPRTNAVWLWYSWSSTQGHGGFTFPSQVVWDPVKATSQHKQKAASHIYIYIYIYMFSSHIVLPVMQQWGLLTNCGITFPSQVVWDLVRVTSQHKQKAASHIYVCMFSSHIVLPVM